ncbi:MAG: ferredoxin [Candidatus Abyssobacteria bacterium SURF_17]|jgi:MinD superfamily P-loop ATPase|uniref:Ferredoxin n=1 Tax=Candidatus Abyssobacteria bacterium SURF_17 TaxID=2093361 RepID=A0A419ETW3_9BACT|nr:MAG: ferredoxin [Candidatus Abyssubacteria bacterium SURF_17]
MMTTVKRKIVKIDEEKCTGCGACVIPCAEGAIEIVHGKARLISEKLCDGAGFCLGICPEGAIVVEERTAEPFSLAAVEEHMKESESSAPVLECIRCGTPENETVLIPCRKDGESVWVCVRCLPPLIHGAGH